MGLDMYLTARRYAGANFMNDDGANQQLAPLADKFLPPDGNIGSITISRDVAYWRKANHIHAWFVTNVQGGADDCRSYDVSVDQLEELRSTCEKVLDCVTRDGDKVIVDEERAKELLPTQGGFFFGNTDYNDSYVDDLEDTIKQLDKVLAWVRAEQLVTGKDYLSVDFEYRASW